MQQNQPREACPDEDLHKSCPRVINSHHITTSSAYAQNLFSDSLQKSPACPSLNLRLRSSPGNSSRPRVRVIKWLLNCCVGLEHDSSYRTSF